MPTRRYIHARHELVLKPWQEAVIPEQGSVSPSQLRSCQSNLRETETGIREDEIRYLNRYHAVEVIERVAIPASLGFLGCLIAITSLAHRHGGSYGFKEPRTHLYHSVMAWYVPPLVGLVLAVGSLPFIYFLSYRWRHTYPMITNIGLRLMEVPPPRSYVIQLKIDDNDLNRIESVDIQQSRTGKLLGYGSLDVQLIGGTNKRLDRVKNPQLVKEILDTARLAHQRPIPRAAERPAHRWRPDDTQPIQTVRYRPPRAQDWM